jgi:hypothetical protein
MLLDQTEPARRFAAGDRGERGDVLLLAPRHPGHQAAGPVDRRFRGSAVALEEGEERGARVCEGESLVGRDGRSERLVGAEAVREQAVHPVLVAPGSRGRPRRECQPVAIGEAHGLFR